MAYIELGTICGFQASTGGLGIYPPQIRGGLL